MIMELYEKEIQTINKKIFLKNEDYDKKRQTINKFLKNIQEKN